MVASDELTDREEWVFCRKLAYGLVASFQEENPAEANDALKRLYRREFIFLLCKPEEWEEEFLQAPEEYFIQYPYVKKFVSQTMYLFADASNGISDEEHDTQDCLFNRLNPEGRFKPFGLLKEK